MTLMLSQPRKRSLFSTFFWLFNVSLLLIVFVGFLPFLGSAILSDAIRGDVPFSILLPVFGLVGVPTTSTAMGIQRKRQIKRLNALLKLEHPTPEPITLFEIFFGLEAPLLMASTIRLFFLRDLTPAGSFLFISLTLGTLAFGHWLLHHHREPSRATWAQLAGLTIMLALSVYLAAIALFYIPPTLMAIAGAVYLALFFFVVLPFLFPFVMVLSGLVSMPWGMTFLFYRSWQQTLKNLSRRHGQRPRLWVGTVLAVWLGILLVLQQQPQTQAFKLLETPPQSEQDRQALLQHTDTIRAGLLNAYLSAYRYPLVENNGIRDLYQNMLGLPKVMASAVQSAYSNLLTPFSYKGTANDKDKAARLYAEFFDAPILRGEHSAIQTAVLSNFNRTEAKAGLLDINADRVKLEQQDITITPQGDWADVELHEVYANTTFENNEILYYFSLPESATVTGLWLGETDDLSQRYNPIVAPRGAAQQVYTDQVRRSVDPALLEQVGPRNYRLRAFPIPPIGQDALPADGKPDKMHLWMTYKVMQSDGQWPLPVLNERRNIFWTKTTKRTLNGKTQKGSQDWLPATISVPSAQAPSTQAPSAQAKPIQAKLPEGYIVANPLKDSDYQLPQGKRLALILDRSYSMSAHQQELAANWQWLQDEVLKTNTADLYLTNVGASKAKQVTNLDAFNPQETTFYGTLTTRQMLEQYQQASASRTYDAIVLLTDAGNYELTKDDDSLSLDAPLWLVHLGGFPAAYDDATLETIQRTDGNTVTDLKTVLTRMATQPSLGEATTLLNVVDGYAWFRSAQPYAAAQTENTAAPLAARQWITQASEAIQPGQLQQLDAIHQVAKQNSIVTPYSSMLVLVNAQQKQQLKEAEQRSDRFQREGEDQQLPDPQNNALGQVSGVPEPAEWLLLVAAVVVLGAWQRDAILSRWPTVDIATTEATPAD